MAHFVSRHGYAERIGVPHLALALALVDPRQYFFTGNDEVRLPLRVKAAFAVLGVVGFAAVGLAALQVDAAFFGLPSAILSTMNLRRFPWVQRTTAASPGLTFR
jgi:hypothetical protein